ncbi:MAG: HEPN domain-containing protein [Endomicrobiales bacterium]
MHYWLQSARHDWDAAQSLLKSGKYDWSLFLGHLVIEKSLKAYWVRDNKGDAPPPFILKTSS